MAGCATGWGLKDTGWGIRIAGYATGWPVVQPDAGCSTGQVGHRPEHIHSKQFDFRLKYLVTLSIGVGIPLTLGGLVLP